MSEQTPSPGLSEQFTLLDDFPAASYEQWRELVEKDLKGAPFEKRLMTHTYEGIDINPVYIRQDWQADGNPSGFPGMPPFTRGSRLLGNVATGWDLRQEHAHPDLAVANRAIHEDLQRGVTSLLLRLDAAARAGLDPDMYDARSLSAVDGLTVYRAGDLDRLLEGVHLNMITAAYEAGASILPVAAMHHAVCEKRGLAPAESKVAFNADPLAVLARSGELPVSVETALRQVGELAAWTDQTFPGSTSLRVGTGPYHHAGATAAQDLAFSMATGVVYLRALTDAGLSIDDACGQLLFNYNVGCNFFLAIAKLRAARKLWGRVTEACGAGDQARAMLMHVRPSKRVLTVRDPWVNILRNTVCVFAGAVANAQVITSEPFDKALGESDAFSRRIARNTQIILQEESHLSQVIDPAGGCWFLESLTDELCEKAWEIFQQIESMGGMTQALVSGWVEREIDSAFRPRAKNLATRRDAITGVSEFANLSETLPAREPIDREKLRQAAIERRQRGAAASDPRDADLQRLASLASDADRDPGELMAELTKVAAGGATISQMSLRLSVAGSPARMTPITPHPYAAPFEALREAADQYAAMTGSRPRVFLACLGPAAQHSARAGYAVNFFEAGGFETIASDPLEPSDDLAGAFAASRASIACLCSSDAIYAERAAEAAGQLKQTGARTVILAGSPGEHEANYRAAGVDRFIFVRCNVVETLRELLREEGALS